MISLGEFRAQYHAACEGQPVTMTIRGLNAPAVTFILQLTVGNLTSHSHNHHTYWAYTHTCAGICNTWHLQYWQTVRDENTQTDKCALLNAACCEDYSAGMSRAASSCALSHMCCSESVITFLPFLHFVGALNQISTIYTKMSFYIN